MLSLTRKNAKIQLTSPTMNNSLDSLLNYLCDSYIWLISLLWINKVHFQSFIFSKMGDVEQLRIDLDKFCSTEESNQNKFENIPSESKSFNCPFWGNSRAFEITLILATLETVLIKIASNGEMPFDFEWKQISQLVKRKILYCIDSMNTKVKHVIKYIILYNPFRPNINQQKNIRIHVIFFCREWKCLQKPPSQFNAFVNSFSSQKNIIRIQINIFMPFWNVFLLFQVIEIIKGATHIIWDTIILNFIDIFRMAKTSRIRSTKRRTTKRLVIQITIT